MSAPLRKQFRNTRKIAQRLTPNQYIAPPVGASVLPSEPYVHNEWDEVKALDNQRQNRTFLKHDDRRKSIPPFKNGADNLELVHQRNDAATKPPRASLQKKSLLPYPIRRTAAMSMLHGGIRTSGLNMPYPDLAVTHSEQLTLPSMQEERRDMRYDAADSGFHLLPLNMHPQHRLEVWHNRCVDLERRLKKEMNEFARPIYSSSSSSENSNKKKNKQKTPLVVFKKYSRFVQPHSSSLRIEPMSDDEWQNLRTQSMEAEAVSAEQKLQPAAHTQKNAFMPFQSLKPHGLGTWSVAGRGGALRPAHEELHQERLNRKGFGWKTMQRSLWQQDRDTHRYTPDRGFS